MKNNILKTVTLLSTITLLASCGSKHNSYPEDYGAETSGTSITMWTPFGTSTIQPIVEDIVEDFENKYNIEVILESKGSYDNLRDAIQLSATSGKYPNITLAYPDHMADYVNSDIILRLDTFFENDSLSQNENTEQLSLSIDDFYKDYLVENQLVEFDKETGKPYTLGVPFNKSTEIMTYNETFMNWLISQDSTIKVPTSWEELETIGEKILAKAEKIYGKWILKDGSIVTPNSQPSDKLLLDCSNLIKAEGGKKDDGKRDKIFIPFSYDSTANLFITLCKQWGGEYTSVDSEGNGKLEFDTEVVKNSLAYIKKLSDKNILAIPRTFDEPKYNSNPFRRMQTIMTIGSTAGADNALPSADAFDVANSPVLFKDTDKKFVISQGTNLILLDKGTDAEKMASWQLLKYLSKEMNATFSLQSGYFPGSPYATNSDIYQDFLNMDPSEMSKAEVQNQRIAIINNDVYMSDEENWNKFVDAPFIGSARCRDEVSTIIPLVLEGNDIDQVIKNVKANLSDIKQ